MEFIQQKCPNCGGELQIPKDRLEIYCLYCGSKLVINQSIQKDCLTTGIPKYEYQKISYDAATGKYPLRQFSINSPDRDNRAIAIMNLWISNQQYVNEWFSDYAKQGWELVDSLNSGCLQIYTVQTNFFAELFVAFFRTPDWTWGIEGWEVNVKRRVN